jgi:hypothetical protein
MLTRYSNHYDREITYSVGRLSAWVEPLLTAGLSIMVLFMALAIFYALVELDERMKAGVDEIHKNPENLRYSLKHNNTLIVFLSSILSAVIAIWTLDMEQGHFFLWG